MADIIVLYDMKEHIKERHYKTLTYFYVVGFCILRYKYTRMEMNQRGYNDMSECVTVL
jgi:hypothetical protein